MKCKKGCTEVVHFVSPEMSSLFDHAIVNMPDGSEKWFNITQPKKWRVKGNDWRKTPLEAHKPIYEYDSKVKDGGITIQTPRMATAEIIYGSSYTGIDRRDQYWKDINAIERFVTELTGMVATDPPNQDKPVESAQSVDRSEDKA